MDLQQLLAGPMGQQVTEMVSQQLGINAEQAQSAINFAVPTLLNGLAKNTQTQQGADALFNAVTTDHSGSGLGNLMGLIQSGLGGDGAGILGHILGGSQPGVQNAVSQVAGIDPQQAGNLLQMVAPILMSVLGNTQQSQGLDAGGLAGLLGNIVSNQQQAAPQQQGFISQLLDQNHDGSMVDDAMRIGMNVLGGLFK